MWLLPPPLRTHSLLWTSHVWVVLCWVLLGGARWVVDLLLLAGLCLLFVFVKLACSRLN